MTARSPLAGAGMMAPMAMPPAGLAAGRGMGMSPGGAAGMAMGGVPMPMPMAGMAPHMTAGGRYASAQQQGGMQRSPRAGGGHGGREGEQPKGPPESMVARFRLKGIERGSRKLCLCALPCVRAYLMMHTGGQLLPPSCQAAALLLPYVPCHDSACAPVSLSNSHDPRLPTLADPAAAARRRATAVCALAGVGDAAGQEVPASVMQAAMADVRSEAAVRESPYADSVSDFVHGPGPGASGGNA